MKKAGATPEQTASFQTEGMTTTVESLVLALDGAGDVVALSTTVRSQTMQRSC